MTLEQEIGRLSEQLKPVDNDTVERAILSLMAFGLALPQGIRPETIRQVYGYSLSALSSGAVKIATEKLMKGDYGPEYANFIPTPPRFAGFVTVEQNRIVNDLAREKSRAESIRKDERIPKTAEEKARVRALISGFKNWHREQKEAEQNGAAIDAPLSPEKRDEIRLMLALPDRGETTFEEREYRSKMAAKLED